MATLARFPTSMPSTFARPPSWVSHLALREWGCFDSFTFQDGGRVTDESSLSPLVSSNFHFACDRFSLQHVAFASFPPSPLPSPHAHRWPVADVNCAKPLGASLPTPPPHPPAPGQATLVFKSIFACGWSPTQASQGLVIVSNLNSPRSPS